MDSPFTNDPERLKAINEALALHLSMIRSGEDETETSRVAYRTAQIALAELSLAALKASRQSAQAALAQPTPEPVAPERRWEYMTYGRAWEVDRLAAYLEDGWEPVGSTTSFVFDGDPCLYSVLRRPVAEPAAPAAGAPDALRDALVALKADYQRGADSLDANGWPNNAATLQVAVRDIERVIALLDAPEAQP